jgi:UDP-2,3-diacylglucosamine pyrophosphatase LpxH
VARTVTTVFEQGMREGQIQRDDPAQLSRLFLACVGEFCEIWIAADPPEEIEHCVEKLMRIFLHGVAVEAVHGRGRRNEKRLS